MVSSFLNPAPGNHWSVRCPNSFAFSKTSYTWNRTLCSFWDWLLSLSIMHFRSIQVVVFFYCWGVFHQLDGPRWVYLFICWRTLGFFSSLGWVWIQLLWSFVYKSLHGNTFLFILGKYLEVGLLSLWELCMLNFMRNCQTGFHSGNHLALFGKQAGLPSCILSSNIGGFQMLCFLVSTWYCQVLKKIILTDVF